MLIVQDEVPAYRRPFFERLQAALDLESIQLSVAVGTAPVDTDAPGESASTRLVPTPGITIAGRTMSFKRLSRLDLEPSLVIVEQALRHLETFSLLARQRRGPNVALWGHGTRLVKPSTRLERFLEGAMTRSAHWFFAYTERGARKVEALGFPANRITVVQNTIDVEELAALRRAVSAGDERLLRGKLHLPPQNVCLFIGRLDAAKRVGFMLDACSIVARRVPEFALVIAGDGPERGLVEESLRSMPWLRYVGGVFGRRKALLGAVSDVLLMPGRVGLVAVDSFALQTPIVTTRWAYHAPEVDYLEDGVNACFSDDDVADFARTLENVLGSRDRLARLKAGCANSSTSFSLDTMVANFAGGVIAALATPGR